MREPRSGAHRELMRIPTVPTVLVAAGLFASLAACGDDDPTPSATADATTTSPPTSAAGSADEEIKPCSSEAPAEAVGLEGDPAEPGAPIVDVVAVEYAFEGVPATLPAGPHGFRLIGEGEEFHELALLRVDDERPIAELLELPEEEQEEVSTYIGGITACPQETSPEALGATLTPGRYALVCFVPVGTTPELRGDDLLAAYENAPHFAEGMVAELTVE